MSRLIVKGLPNKVTEEKLRNTFSSKGILTDVQLKYTKDGKFRHFAFIGFQTAEESEAAIKYFDGTYMGASKMSVEVCADLGDKSKPRAWSKHASDSSAFQKNNNKSEEKEELSEKDRKKEKKKQKKVNSLLDKYKDDPKFQEFLRVHQGKKLESWNNDAILEVGKLYNEEDSTPIVKEETTKVAAVSSKDEELNENEEDEDETEAKVALKQGLSDLDYLKAKKEPTVKKVKEKVDYFTVKLSGLHYKAKKKDVKLFLAPLKPKSVRVPPKVRGIAYVGFETEKEMKQALNKNKSFLSGHQIFVNKYDKPTDEKENAKFKEQEDGLVGEETVAESGRLFLRNLSYSVTEDDVEKLFVKFGPLTEVTVPVDRLTRKVKGFAFVTFMLPEHAVAAFSELDGSTFQGRLLHIIPGKAKVGDGEENEDDGGGNFKKKKQKSEKAKAGSSHNWNSLFLGGSAVADLMAEQYGVDKAAVVLEDGKQSAAVRLAMGETQIVADTRQFLEENGIKLDAFSRPPDKRSKTTLLVKNLPAKTPLEEIRDLFSVHGEIGRLVLPPSGITAIVEFHEPSEARKAFMRLAYTKFHSTPLYLEWAPEDTFTTSLEDTKKETEVVKVVEAAEKDEEEDSEEAEEGGTLFVKNLNFSTTEESLREHFSPAGKLFSVTIATKKEPVTGNSLSMGFGFVQFVRKSSADRCLKTLQHSRLDEHCLELKRSNRAASQNEKTSRKQQTAVGKPTTKILVRNIPFQATKNEIQDIFKTFGEIKDLRLPKKMSGTGPHRGFAFIDYENKSDAKKAFEAMCHSTHLYGRRLVLEWAAQEETVEELRRKTAEHFGGDQPKNKSRKIDMSGDV